MSSALKSNTHAPLSPGLLYKRAAERSGFPKLLNRSRGLFEPAFEGIALPSLHPHDLSRFLYFYDVLVSSVLRPNSKIQNPLHYCEQGLSLVRDALIVSARSYAAVEYLEFLTVLGKKLRSFLLFMPHMNPETWAVEYESGTFSPNRRSRFRYDSYVEMGTIKAYIIQDPAVLTRRNAEGICYPGGIVLTDFNYLTLAHEAGHAFDYLFEVEGPAVQREYRAYLTMLIFPRLTLDALSDIIQTFNSGRAPHRVAAGKILKAVADIVDVDPADLKKDEVTLAEGTRILRMAESAVSSLSLRALELLTNAYKMYLSLPLPFSRVIRPFSTSGVTLHTADNPQTASQPQSGALAYP